MDALKAHQMPSHIRTHASCVLPLEVKAIGDTGMFQGYASVFDRLDLSGDVVAPGAFRDTLAQRGAQGVKLLYQHDVNEPIGVLDNAPRRQPRPLCRGRILTDIERGRDVLALMKAGAVDGLSIGFKTVRARRTGAAPVVSRRSISGKSRW